MGLSGFGWRIYAYNLLANAFVAFAGYFLFGGGRLMGLVGPTRGAPGRPTVGPLGLPGGGDEMPFRWQHGVTLGVITALVVGVVGFRVHVGMGAFTGAALLSLIRATDEKAAIRTMPWGVILMVCGVTMLTALLEQTGGVDLFTSLLAKFSTRRSVTGVIALVVGLVSVYSSTSGVVLPTFLPSVPGLVEKLGGGDPLAIASSILVGGHLVDVSPLSTIGALCVAGAAAGEDRDRLFNRVLAWGLSMAGVGAVLCYVAFGLLW
jgi:di/tricarboxylate transporter